MREVLAILNDRITVNSINGRAEAVSALKELREAILGPLKKAEQEIIHAMNRFEMIEAAREGWARYEKGQAVETIKAVRQTLSA
jgi:hypothetical protein